MCNVLKRNNHTKQAAIMLHACDMACCVQLCISHKLYYTCPYMCSLFGLGTSLDAIIQMH